MMPGRSANSRKRSCSTLKQSLPFSAPFTHSPQHILPPTTKIRPHSHVMSSVTPGQAEVSLRSAFSFIGDSEWSMGSARACQSSGMATRRPRSDPLRSDRVRLRDGRTLLLRPVAAADAGPIAGGFVLLNEHEVRQRFLHPVKALDEAHLQRLTEPGQGGFAIVAAEPLAAGEALVGAVARVARDDDEPERAEFAILVSHFLAGQGLGKRLLARLFEWARANGVRELWGDVADDNDAMLQLAERTGFRRERRHAQPGVTRIVRRLRP